MTDIGPLLRAEGISVRRGGRLLLDGVSFAAAPAAILGIIGPNGAGKTTLFAAVAGFVPLASGRVERNAELFYLPDGIRPWPDQRVGWCLDFFAGLFGRERDGEAVDALQLARLLPQRAGSLSKGEARRVALALALATPQPLLLLDEPFDGLDFRQTRAAMELLRSRAAAGRTLVLSIHQLTDAARVCDRFLLLDHGRAIAEGDLGELRSRVAQPQASLEEVFLALE
jgi:ABC-2 type transport system ATP-binding protein